MTKKFKYKHSIIRILIILILIPIASVIGLSTLNPDRWCGTGDGLVVVFYVFIVYCIWALALFIEAYFLHKKLEFRKRNLNIIMALALPVLLLLVYIYFEIVDLLN